LCIMLFVLEDCHWKYASATLIRALLYSNMCRSDAGFTMCESELH